MKLWEAAAIAAAEGRMATYVLGWFRVRPRTDTGGKPGDVVYEELDLNAGQWKEVTRDHARSWWPTQKWWVGAKGK